MISLRRYTANDAPVWDAFVKGSRNGTFLFERAYMDYHADRFTDHSLLIYNEKNQLIALFPSNEREGCLYSHQGLTYGGLVVSLKMTAAVMCAIVDAIMAYGREVGMKTIYYKQMPDIYHLCPTEEDEYALWLHGATLEQVLISTTLPLKSETIPTQQYCRRHGRSKALEAGYSIQMEGDLEEFWPIMERNLRERYGIAPVHTLEEMQLLQQRFPLQIKCMLARNSKGKAEAGAVIYEANRRTVHVQYGHATPEGKRDGALDMLYFSLIDHYRDHTEAEYFDFGNSNEQGGHYLNENLIAQKEGFGGRGITYKLWKLDL